MNKVSAYMNTGFDFLNLLRYNKRIKKKKNEKENYTTYYFGSNILSRLYHSDDRSKHEQRHCSDLSRI